MVSSHDWWGLITHIHRGGNMPNYNYYPHILQVLKKTDSTVWKNPNKALQKLKDYLAVTGHIPLALKNTSLLCIAHCMYNMYILIYIYIYSVDKCTLRKVVCNYSHTLRKVVCNYSQVKNFYPMSLHWIWSPSIKICRYR